MLWNSLCCVQTCQQSLPPLLPVVMTTPASTFRRACGDVKLSVSSLNLSTTRRETASARTWNYTHAHTQRQTEQQEAMHTCRHTNTSLCQICQLTKHVWCYPPLEHCVPVTVLASASNSTRSVETATSETRLTPWGIPNHLSSNAVWVLSDSYNLPSPSWQWITRQKKKREEQSKQANLSNRCSVTPHKGLKIESKLCENFTSLLLMDTAPLAALYSSLMWWKMTTSMRRDDGWVIAN